jgi:hypothetical protein
MADRARHARIGCEGVQTTLRASGLTALRGGSIDLVWDTNAIGALIPDFRINPD